MPSKSLQALTQWSSAGMRLNNSCQPIDSESGYALVRLPCGSTDEVRAPSVADLVPSSMSEACCPLCTSIVDRRSLIEHMDTCSANVISCPYCFEAIAVNNRHEHLLSCPRNVRCCYVCQCLVPSANLAGHLQTCGKGKVVRMFHGTSLESARSIMREGFRPSVKGLLGEGVYVTKDPQKAKRYGDVIVECDVHVGSVAVINRKHHPLQKCWAAHGYSSAWIPPQSGVVASGMEEHCVFDTHRIVPLSMASAV